MMLRHNLKPGGRWIAVLVLGVVGLMGAHSRAAEPDSKATPPRHAMDEVLGF